MEIGTYEAAQRASALDRRNKLYGNPVKEKVAKLRTEKEYQLEEELIAMRAEKKRLQDKISALEWNISDYQARLLSQANEICSLQGIELTFSPKKKTVGDIISVVLKKYPGITLADLISVRRTKALIEPRHLAMAAVHDQRPDLSLPAIGRIFGNRDHSSVHHAIQNVKNGKFAK